MASAKAAARRGELGSTRRPGWLGDKHGQMKVARGAFKKQGAAKGFGLILFTLAVTGGSKAKE